VSFLDQDDFSKLESQSLSWKETGTLGLNPFHGKKLELWCQSVYECVEKMLSFMIMMTEEEETFPENFQSDTSKIDKPRRIDPWFHVGSLLRHGLRNRLKCHLFQSNWYGFRNRLKCHLLQSIKLSLSLISVNVIDCHFHLFQ